ncbi:MAG: hypothetical protein ACC661_10305 [Verrucomicrobiales bacterium]
MDFRRAAGPMNFEYSIDVEANLVRTRCTGAFTIDGLIEEMKKIAEDPLFRPGMNMLGDYSEGEWIGEVKGMTDFIDFSEEVKEARGSFKSAVILRDEAARELVTMFDLVARQRDIGMETRGFATAEEALEWLQA